MTDSRIRPPRTRCRTFRARALDFGGVAAVFRFALMALAGVLPVLLIGGTLVLWTNGNATAGDIAAAGAISIRIAQMTGWVSFTLMGIYCQRGRGRGRNAYADPAHTGSRIGTARPP